MFKCYKQAIVANFFRLQRMPIYLVLGRLQLHVNRSARVEIRIVKRFFFYLKELEVFRQPITLKVVTRVRKGPKGLVLLHFSWPLVVQPCAVFREMCVYAVRTKRSFQSAFISLKCRLKRSFARN